MYTYQYLFTNPSPLWRTSLWSLWKFIVRYTGRLFHISYNTFFYNTLQSATSIFKWRSWCQWISFCLFPSSFLSWFHNMHIALRYYKVSGHCHQLAFNKEHSIETIPVPVLIWDSRNSPTWLGLITKANLNHCVLFWKRDDGCPKSVHPKSTILSSQHFRNYMNTTTLSSQNFNIKLFCSHKYYLYHVDTFHWLHLYFIIFL